MELAGNETEDSNDFGMMVKGATNALKSVLSFSQGENLLIVLDDSCKDIGKAFITGAQSLGSQKADLYSLSCHKRPLKELPGALKTILPEYNVIVNAFGSDAQETPFRVELIYEEIAYNARVGHAPGITKEMMYKGPMNVNYEEIVRDAMDLMESFKSAKEVHITTELGTDLVLDIENRGFSTDVIINKGSFGNLPAGEVWCAPTETKGDGVVIVDGSIGDIGNVSAPLKLTIEKGKLVKMECEDLAMVEELWGLLEIDPMAKIIGELGIGLNPNAKLTGNLLEDEKAGETAHIAFGNNMDMDKGQNNSKTHRDFLFKKPTFVVTYTDGSTKKIIENGKVILN